MASPKAKYKVSHYKIEHQRVSKTLAKKDLLQPVTTAVRGHNSRILVFPFSSVFFPLRRASGTLDLSLAAASLLIPQDFLLLFTKLCIFQFSLPGLIHQVFYLPPIAYSLGQIFPRSQMQRRPLSCLLSLAASRTPQQKMTTSFRFLATANVRRGLQNYSVPRFGCCTASLRITLKPTHRVPLRAKFVSHFSVSFPSSEQTANG